VRSNGLKNPDQAAKDFGYLLSAFYLRHRPIVSLEHLSRLVDLADFYCALPILRNFVESSLLGSPLLINEIPRESSRALVLSQRIQSILIFREAFIHVVGKWHSWDYVKRKAFIDITGPRIHELVQIHHGKLRDQVAKAGNYILVLLTGKRIKNQELQEAMTHELLSVRSSTEPALELDYYKAILNAACRVYDDALQSTSTKRGCPTTLRQLKGECENTIRPLFENSTVFSRSSVPEKRPRYNYFLCTALLDEEIPWDITEY
jgi:hypothetical protein